MGDMIEEIERHWEERLMREEGPGCAWPGPERRRVQPPVSRREGGLGEEELVQVEDLLEWFQAARRVLEERRRESTEKESKGGERRISRGGGENKRWRRRQQTKETPGSMTTGRGPPRKKHPLQWVRKPKGE